MRALTSLSPGALGDAVADLHRGLDELGFGRPITGPERAEHRYGDGTRDAVTGFQRQFGLPAAVPGTLDRDSAERLTAELVERGILQVVQGRLVSADGTALPERLIFGFDADFVNGAQLAEASTNADGAYRMSYDPRFYATAGPGHERVKDGPLELVVCGYDTGGEEIARSAARRDPGRSETVDLVAGDQLAGDFVVRGIVRDLAGRPAAGVAVAVWDRDLGDRRELLGEAVTGGDGTFRIGYSAAAFRAAEGRGTGADLVFALSVREQPVTATVYRVLAGLRAAQPLSAEDLLLGIPAGPDEEVAFELTTSPAAPGSEYARLLVSLRPLLDGRSPADLDEAAHRDISFAAREIGGDRDRVGLLAGAHRLAERTFDGKVPADLLYGLGRCDLHLTDLARLTLAGAEQLRDGIRQAIDRAIVDAHPRDEIDAVVAHLVATGPELIRAGAGGSGYGPVLDVALPDPVAQRVLLRAAAGRQGDPGSFWDELSGEPAFAEPGTIERTQLALQLDALTGRHLPLMAALQTEHGIVAAEDLLDLSQADLTELVSRVGVPAGTAGADDVQRAEVFAAGLLGQVHQAFPTAVVAKAVAAAPADAVGGEPVRAALATVLSRAGRGELRTQAGFDLATTHLDTFLAEHGDALLDGVDPELRDRVVPELKRTQRLHRVSTGPAAMQWLLAQPYRSAFDIAQHSQQTFLAGASELDRTEAMMIHSRAQTVATSALATFVHLVDARHDSGIAALVGGKDKLAGGVGKATGAAGIDDAVAKHLPTWRELFGDVDWCSCSNCRSIYSPAAYLVDLLNFLDVASPNGAGQRPLDVLLARRPDLAQLPLTCENTNTATPYVDLVNEVLESLVASLDTTAIPAYDVAEATAPELAAAPQHTDWSAYVTPPAPARSRPDRAAYPHTLPFDAALSAAREFLVHLGAPRSALIGTFATGAPVHALAAERLGLAPATFELITGVTLTGDPATPVPLDERYGWTVLPPEALSTGAAGRTVWALKQMLNAAGAALAIGADPAGETYDAAVGSAVTAYQGGQGLPATGVVDAATWAALIGSGPALSTLLLPHLPTLLERAGLGYDELIALLRTRFVNPAQEVFETVHRLGLPGADLVAYVAGGLVAPSAAMLAALGTAGVAEPDFADWAQLHLTGDAWQRVRRTILADRPDAGPGTSLDAVVIRHWAADEADLDETEWLRLDRLIRLWRATGWAIEELDLALSGLAADELTADVVSALGRMAELAAGLDLGVAPVVALWADLDPSRPGSLYHQRFRNRALSRADPAFDPDWRGAVLAGAVVGEHLSTLQAGLRTGGNDVAVLRARLGLTADTAALDLSAVSAMLRHVMLARALGLNVRDLISLIDVIGLDPATAPGPGGWPATDFVTEVRRLQLSELNPAQLADLLADLSAPPADPARERLLTGLSEGLRAIEADLDPATERDGALTRRSLTMLAVPAPLVDAALRVLTGTDSTTAVLPAPAAPAPVIPPEWTGRLRYQPQDRALTVVGALTDAERDTVTGFTPDPGWATVVQAAHATARDTLGQLAAALAPAGITAPAPATLLAAPLGDDPALREAAITARLTLLLDAALPVLRDRERRTLITQSMLAAVPDAETAALLLTGTRAAGGPVLPATDPAQPLIADLLGLGAGVGDSARRAYELLQRVQVLADGFNVRGVDLRVLLGDVVVLRDDPARLLRYADVQAVAAYARVRNRPGQPAGRLADAWSAPDDETARIALAEAVSVPVEVVADLMAADGLALAIADLRAPQATERLVAAADLVVALGVAVPVAARWAREPNGQSIADEIRRAVKARYDEATWLEVAKTLSDAQRERRRAALVDYLVPRLGTGDANGLYQRLLIDVEMGACMLTSRIKQAIASVQLFVQRCLLNLEPLVPPSLIDQGQWEWMRGHPLWAANRQVLVNPENWVLPELRDDKSPFFRDLEGELLSDDLTEATAERAIAGYLTKLDSVAKLDVTTMHVQRDFEPAEKLQTVVHVFGSTANTPQTMFYRRFVVTAHGTQRWTPWEPVPLDVRGELVTAVTFNRRLYLFWAQLTTKDKEPAAGTKAAQEAQHYQEIQLCWSEYRDGAWGQKHVTDGANVLVADYEPETGPDGGVTVQGTRGPKGVIERLETRIDGDRLLVLCIASRSILWTDDDKHLSHTSKYNFDEYGNLIEAEGNQGYTYSLGTFTLDGCHGQLRADDLGDQTWLNSGAVLRTGQGTLEIKPLSKQPIAASTVLGKAADLRLGQESWISDGEDFVVVSDPGRAYFGRLTLLGDALTGVLQNSKRAYPELATAHDSVSTATVDLSHLAAVRAVADQAGHSWAGATATLASPVLAGIVDGSAPHSGLVAQQIERIGALFAVPKQVATVTFETFYDPFACTYLKRLQQYGIDGVLTLANQQLTSSPGFAARYAPNALIVKAPQPSDQVDFGAAGAYANAHWELFFHIPMLIQSRLRQNRRYEESLRFLRYVWDFTDPTGDTWKVLPLRTTPKESVEDWLTRLSAGDPDLKRQIAEWRDHPYQPHLLARMRLSAYQKYVVMECYDTMLEWADAEFRLDTMESINRAALLYVTVAEMLSTRPQDIGSAGEPAPQTFAMMRGKLDALGNVAAEFENAFPSLSSSTLTSVPEAAGMLGIARSLYFCVPPNEKLMAYWDTVADRLFKIRNCMNISGVVRRLPLWEKPIDPALLVRAAAQGIDIGSVLADANAPLPPHRFEVVLRRAYDSCANLRSLGSALTSALERRDSEDLAALQASQEIAVLRAELAVRKKQEEEADAQIAALTVSRDVPAERLRYYRWLMGADGKIPKPGEAVAMASYGPQTQAQGGAYLIQEELNELAASHSARDWQVRATMMNTLASLSHYIPSFATHVEPWGVGVELEFGGQHVGPALTAVAHYLAGLGAQDEYDAMHAGKMAKFRRLGQDYAIGANAAALELLTIDKQVTTAMINKEITTLERQQLESRIAQAELVESRLTGKYTNAELYGWLQGQLGALYFQAYQLCYETAKQAERCYRFAHGLTDSSIIQFGAWDSLRKGLLAGERLQLQLQQLERAYANADVRKLELTKHVSLLQHAPMALIKLRETGSCEVDVPELLFDLDHPGHYQRRIKSVSLTIPAVVGPYASVNATLTMLSNETRVSPALRAGRYERDLENDDPRFVDDFAAVQQIATSGGRNDSGLFELNFRDERLLPFEGGGAAGRFRIDLDPDCNPFPMESVTDVVLTLFYTSCDGGPQLRAKAKEHWRKLLADQERRPLSRVFSLRHEFPGEWHRLRTVAAEGGEHTQLFALTRDRFPMVFRHSALSIGALDVFGVPADGATPTKLPSLRTPKPAEDDVELAAGSPLSPLLHAQGIVGPVPVQTAAELAQWRLTVAAGDVASIEQLDDILIVCHYSAASAPA